jgi:16S rRNA (adenine1518-N6/adenine1519-N6)-dimethyltransferase
MQEPPAGFRPRRRFGQNFLVDRGAIDRMLAAFRPDGDDLVLEIGPGQGALTRLLMGRVAALAAVEIDRDLAARLEGDLARQAPPGTLTIIRADILEIDLPALLSGLGARSGRPARVIANLPYNVATAVILRLLPQAPLLRDLLVMVQREVALRILSPPGRKTYGGLSVLCQACARVESVLRLRPGSFRPRPKVESEVIRLTLRDRDGRAAAAGRQDLERLLRVAFEQRRKTLLNNLARLPPFPGAPPSVPSLGPAAASHLIRGAGLDPAARPETVPVEGFLALTDSWRAGRA